MAESHEAAIAHVRAYAESRREDDLRRLETALARTVDADLVDQLVLGMRSNCRLTLNFHPDRLMADRRSVAEGLLVTGEYRPQSLTGLSNGMRFSPDGDRTQWEQGLFGDAYAEPSTRRPVYGALDLTNDPFGGSPRFGSCFAVLTSRCFDRSTFCVGDSHVGPSDIGTIDSPVGLLAGLFESAINGNALDRGLDVEALRQGLIEGHHAEGPARDLDHYVEMQVHGPVLLKRDVDAIVADPSFLGTNTETALNQVADRYDIALRWHHGSALAVAEVPSDYRGPEMPTLAAAVAGGTDAVVDAASIGRALAAIPFTPPAPTGDAPDNPLQQHKKLWHCLLRFGHCDPPELGGPKHQI